MKNVLRFSSIFAVTILVAGAIYGQSNSEGNSNAGNAIGGILGTCSNMVFNGNGEQAPDLFARCSEIVFRGDAGAALIVSRDEVAVQTISAKEVASTQQGNIAERMNEVRIGGRGVSVANLRRFGGADLAPALAKAAQQGSIGGAGGTNDPSPFGLFVNGDASTGDRDPNGNDVGFDVDSVGVTLGVDYRFSDSFFGGIALGINQTEHDLTGTRDVSGNGLGTLDVDGMSLSLYGSLSLSEQWYLEGTVTAGRNEYDSITEVNYDIGTVTATIDDGQVVPILLGGTTRIRQQAVGDTEGDLLSGRLGLGNDWRSGAFGIQTVVSANYTEIDIDAYDERMVGTGGGSELAIGFDQRTIESLTGELELLFSYTNLTNWGSFEPVLTLGYVHQFEDDASQINTELVADPNRASRVSVAAPGNPLQNAGVAPGNYGKDLTVLTEAPEDGWVVAGLGFTAAFRGGNQLFLFWDTIVGHDLLSLNRFSGGFRFEF